MTANTTPQESQEDYGDLLLGLGDDDLNDFDGLDDFGDDLDEASEQMHRSQREQASAKGKLELHGAYERELTSQVTVSIYQTPSLTATAMGY
jgi:hypothetical protein